jgi:hypothetical protein
MLELFPVWLTQTPGVSLNDQLWVVGAIIVCVGGLGVAGKYIWDRIEKQNEADRVWRETQNAKREAHESKLADSWQSAVDSIDLRREKGEESRNAAILRLTEYVTGVSTDLKAHHEQARAILEITKEIDKNTRPANGEKRKPGNGF